METSTVELKDAAVLYKPDLHAFERDGARFFVDAAAPNWIATDARGAELLGQVDGNRTLGEIRRRYAALKQSLATRK